MIVFSKKRSNHIADLRAVLERIRSAVLKLNRRSVSCFRDQVLYLGYLISVSGVAPDRPKLQVFVEWPKPTTVREMQSFLGVVNLYGDYIADATKLTNPLYYLNASKKGDDPVQLSAENIKSFEEIKSRLCAGPRLAYPDLERPFVLYTDASKIAVGAVLLQSDSDGIEHAVSVFSK